MFVGFQKSFYLSSIEEDKLSQDEKAFNLQFHYGNATYKKFSEKYVAKGWIRRKIEALPLVLWSAIVETIYHLGKALILGIPKSFSSEGNYLKAQIFYIGRDFQESFGRLVSLFNDRYGLYHIQESRFHKNFYEQALKKFARTRQADAPTKKSEDTTSGSKDFPSGQDNQGPVNYESMTTEQTEKLFPPFEKENTIKSLTNLSEEDFRKVAKKLSKFHFPLLRDQHLVDRLDYDSMTHEEIECFFPYYFTEQEESIETLTKISEDNFKKVADKFNDNHFSLMRDKRLVNRLNLLNYQSMTKAQVAKLFPDYEEKKEETIELLVKLFPENFKKVSGKLNCHFSLMHDSRLMGHLNHLDYDSMTNYQVEELFPYYDEEKKEETIELLVKLSLENFKKVSVKFYDGHGHFSLMHDSRLVGHLNHLDYDSMTNAQVEDLFPYYDEDKKDETIELLGKLFPENLKKLSRKFYSDDYLSSKLDSRLTTALNG